MDKALLIVDVQNDFCEGGSLAVPRGAEVAGPLAELARAFAGADGAVFASRDWHPAMTRHFAEWGGKWPPHCVQGTRGAELHADLTLPPGAVLVSKGRDPEQDSYSAFQGVDERGRALAELLAARGVRELFVGGLATDYCVRASALDALAHGLRVTLLADAVRAVDVQPGDGARALDEMRAAGVRVSTTGEVAQVIAHGEASRSESRTG